MTNAQYNAAGPTARVMRKRAGAWLKGLRVETGLTQAEVAIKLGINTVTTISQLERGLGRVPPEDWNNWAAILRQDPRVFAKTALYWYDPHAHFAIFGGVHPQDAENLPREQSNEQRGKKRGPVTGRGAPEGPDSD